jgi:hypothetical protein
MVWFLRFPDIFAIAAPCTEGIQLQCDPVQKNITSRFEVCLAWRNFRYRTASPQAATRSSRG